MHKPLLISNVFALLILLSPASSSANSCTDPESLRSSTEETLPLITYSLTFENLTNENTLESVEYWQYKDFSHGKKIENPPQTKLDIWLLCNHTKPAKWVSDTKYAEQPNVKLTSYTYRQARNYSDPSTERFIGVIRLQIEPTPTSPIVYICEDIQNPCNSRIVLITVDDSTESFVLQNYNYSEIQDHPDIAEFVSERKRVEIINRANNDTCPFKLSLYYVADPDSSGELWYDWHEDSETAAAITFPTYSQMRENNYRLTPNLGEHCVTRTHLNFTFERNYTCPSCRVYEYWNEKSGYPQVTLYNRARGHIRVFHVYFDLNIQTLYFMSEQADNDDLTQILDSKQNPEPLEFYRGQNISFNCAPSVVKFSAGVIVLWAFPGEEPREAIPFNDDDSFVNGRGANIRPIHLTISKELLDDKNASSINVTCLFPVWNTTEWVPKSSEVVLKESAYPLAVLSGDLLRNDTSEGLTVTLNVGEDFDVTCNGTGIPLPEIKFNNEKQNLNYTVSNFTTDSYVGLTLRLKNVDNSAAGTYRCNLKNAVGETSVSFKLIIIKRLSTYVVVILTLLGAAVTVFIIAAVRLGVQYRKERVEFQRKTEEAIRRFHEGFQGMKAITFASSSEYKAYELPLTHWDFGGTIIGKGAFGTVHKGLIRKGQRVTVVAVKTVNAPKDITEFETSLKELLIMAYIGKHPHIISLVATCTDNMAKRNLMLATEFCANGDLLSFLRKNKSYFCLEGKSSTSVAASNEPSSYLNIEDADDKFFSFVDMNVWSLQIADGMAFLESKKVLHGDLAARNVLLTEHKIAKISDFGLSRQLSDDDNYTKKTQCPLPWKWMALESLQYQVFSSKSDVWSYGVTLYEIFSTGEETWPYLDWTTEFVDELVHGRRPTKPQFATQEMYDKVMLEAWRNEAEERPSFADIKAYFEPIVHPKN